MPDLTATQIESLALEARAYAREQIKEGTTQLQYKTYDLSKQLAIKKALTEIRNATVETEFFLKVNTTITAFEKRIEDCKKLAVGNCFELALMALHYVLKKNPQINAEAYNIKGGDHAFLVIGRDKNSDPTAPETWGESAYICDPWSDAVYPAQEYLEKMDDFNPENNKLEPLKEMNSDKIIEGSQKLNDILLDVFNTINQKYFEIYDTLANDLDKTAKELAEKYGAEDPKVKILNEKIGIIRLATTIKKKEFNLYIEKITEDATSNHYIPHINVNNDLQSMMKTQLNVLRELSSLSDEETNTLKQYRNEDSLLTMIMKFLNIGPSSSRQYNSALKKTEEEVNSFSETINNNFGG